MAVKYEDAVKHAAAHFAELNRRISVKEEHIVLLATEDHEYSVPLFKCSNYDEILSWTFHLSEKNWMNRDLLRHFMRVAFDANNLPVPPV